MLENPLFDLIDEVLDSRGVSASEATQLAASLRSSQNRGT